MSSEDQIPRTNKANKTIQWANEQGHTQAVVVNELIGIQEGITEVFGWTIGDPGLHKRAGFRHLLPLHLRISARVHRVSFLHPSLDQELPMKKLGVGTCEFAGDVPALLENERYRLSRDGIVGNHMKRKRREEEKNKKDEKKKRTSNDDKESDGPTITGPKGKRQLIVMSSKPPSANKKKSNASPMKFEQLLDKQNKCAKLIGDDSNRRKKYVTREISTRFESEEIAGTGTEFAAYLKVATTPEIYGGGRFLPQVACRVPRSSVCFEMKCNSDHTVKSTQPFVVEAPHIIWGGAKDKLFRSIADDGSPLIDARNLEYLTNSELQRAVDTESLLIMGTTVYVDIPPDPSPEGPTFKGTKHALKKGTVIATKKTVDYTKKVGKFAGKALHSLDKKHSKNGDEETQKSDETASNHGDLQAEDNQHVRFADRDEFEEESHDDSTQGGNIDSVQGGNIGSVESHNHKDAQTTLTISEEKPKIDMTVTNILAGADHASKKTVDAVGKFGKKTFDATVDTMGKATNVVRPQKKENKTNDGNVGDRKAVTVSAASHEGDAGQQSSAISADGDATGDQHRTAISDDTKEGTDETVYRRKEDNATKPDSVQPASSSKPSTKHKKKSILKKAAKGIFSLGHKNKKKKKKEGSKNGIEADELSVSSAPPIVGSSGSVHKDWSRTKAESKPVAREDASHSKPQIDRADSLSDVDTDTDTSVKEAHKTTNVSSVASTSETSDSATEGKKPASQSKFSEENTKGKGRLGVEHVLEPFRKMGAKSSDNTKEIRAKGTQNTKEIGAKGAHHAKEIGTKGAHNLKKAAINIEEGAKKMDDKLEKMDQKYREKKEEEKKVELPQPKRYTLVLDEVIDFRVVGFPTGEVLATFPISVASILNSRTMDERQCNPLQPSEMTVTLVQEPSTADGMYGVETVVTFRVAEVQPRTSLAIEEPERDDAGKKVTSRTKLKRMKVRLQNIGKSREEISEMVAEEEERLAAEAEAREQAIVEAGIGRGYEQGAPRREIVQRQMFYDPDIHPHFSRERRDNRIKLKGGDKILRVDANSFLTNLNILGESGSFSDDSLLPFIDDDAFEEEAEKTPSTFMEAPHQLFNDTTRPLLPLSENKEFLDSPANVPMIENDGNLAEHSFTDQESVGWSLEGSAKSNTSVPQRGNLKDLQMKSMWKSITDLEYKKTSLLNSGMKGEGSSADSIESESDSSSDESEIDAVPQSSEVPLFLDLDKKVSVDSSGVSHSDSLQSSQLILEGRESGGNILLPADVPNVETFVASVEMQEQDITTVHGAKTSEVSPSAELALPGVNPLPRETRSLLYNSMSITGSKTTGGNSMLSSPHLKAEEFQNIDSFIQNKRRTKSSTLPAFMRSTIRKQSYILDSDKKNTFRRSNQLPSEGENDTKELSVIFAADEISVEVGVNPSNSEEKEESLIKKPEKDTTYFLFFFPLLLGLLLGYFSRYVF